MWQSCKYLEPQCKYLLAKCKYLVLVQRDSLVADEPRPVSVIELQNFNVLLSIILLKMC